jgi:hypothetical protein
MGEVLSSKRSELNEICILRKKEEEGKSQVIRREGGRLSKCEVGRGGGREGEQTYE